MFFEDLATTARIRHADVARAVRAARAGDLASLIAASDRPSTARIVLRPIHRLFLRLVHT